MQALHVQGHTGQVLSASRRFRARSRRSAVSVHASTKVSDVLKAKPLGVDLDSYPSLEGKNVLVTGSARGIGFNSARVLAALGASVYLADIDVPALRSAAESIRKENPRADVRVSRKLDLGNTSAVHEFADAWLAGRIDDSAATSSLSSAASSSSSTATAAGASSSSGSSSSSTTIRTASPCGGPVPPVLHVLLNNAGANFMGVDPWHTEQGVAGLPQVNFVGPYTLTRRLMPALSAAGSGSGSGPRVVNVASVMHRFSRLPEDPEFFLKDWWVGGAYRSCKHANVVFSLLLDQAAREGRAQVPTSLIATAVDPGAVYSNIWATSRILGRPPGSTIIKQLFSTPEDACATSVHACVAADVRGGQYYARGLFARSGIVKGTIEPVSGAISCLDWPLRNLSGGSMASYIRSVEIAQEARNAATDGRGVALWNAAAELAGLDRW